MSRRSDGLLVDYAATFLDLPLWCAPLGAAAIYIVLAYLPGLVVHQPPSSMELVIVPICKGLAPWVAGGVLLSGLLGAVNRAVNRWIAGRRRQGGPPPMAESPSVAAPVSVSGAVPTCPRCGGPMVQRVARKGPNSGQSFWGCQGYPRCKGTVG